jgi:hypothetical protein
VETNFTLLLALAYLADPFDYTTYVNQLILVNSFIEHGANVNVSNPHRASPETKYRAA